LSPALNIEGRVVAIAGAGGGLGPSVVKRLGNAGAVVCASDVAAERIERLGSQLGLGSDRFDARAVDLLGEAAARSWRDALLERFGRVDALLHLVGGWRGGVALAEAPLNDYEWLHDLLVRTVQHATRAFRDALADAGGSFALVSSAQAQRPSGTNAAYAAAKAAAEAWTLALADDLREAGSRARANVVVVNAILTPEMRERNPDKEYRAFTRAEDIAEALAFLCSDAAAKMNGQRLSLHP
jgi:NAD(P)-dependent dehydrogenase (short-subunit alcohol dehydrogenase family)